MSNQDPARWAIIRQVVIGAEDLDATSKELCDRLGLSEGFPDPMLEDIGLGDETIRVGSEAHLEVVATLDDRSSMNAWLAKGKGGGGYALSIQVPNIAAHEQALKEQGVRLVADLEVYGHRIVQLHPKDMGLLIELDEIADPTQWFWDDIKTEEPIAPLVDDVLGIDMQSAAPEQQAQKWAAVFGVPVEDRDGQPYITLGSRVINFVEGERNMFSAIDLKRVDGVEAPETLDISGVLLRLR